MIINQLKERTGLFENKRLTKTYTQFDQLLKELAKKEIPIFIIDTINQAVDEVNTSSLPENEWRRLIKKNQWNLLKLVEKELKIVPLNYYRNLWLAIGMAAFGVPIGMAMQASSESSGYLAIGFPIGMLIGMVLGSRLDKKAFEEGRQLDVEIK